MFVYLNPQVRRPTDSGDLENAAIAANIRALNDLTWPVDGGQILSTQLDHRWTHFYCLAGTGDPA